MERSGEAVDGGQSQTGSHLYAITYARSFSHSISSAIESFHVYGVKVSSIIRFHRAEYDKGGFRTCQFVLLYMIKLLRVSTKFLECKYLVDSKRTLRCLDSIS